MNPGRKGTHFSPYKQRLLVCLARVILQANEQGDEISGGGTGAMRGLH
jgi:hypothetical protein